MGTAIWYQVSKTGFEHLRNPMVFTTIRANLTEAELSRVVKDVKIELMFILNAYDYEVKVWSE